ncbi:MAG: transcriptional regulator NrdR, partial [Ruminococcus sp.]|nr:transcriptional regulator NrdR [Ruminococcus sp.]
DYIEKYYANALTTVAPSKEIGEIVLEKLREIDPISYIRFASVYKDFTDIESFVAAISEFEQGE